MDRNVIRAIFEDLCSSFCEAEFLSFFKDIAHDINHSLPTGGTLASLIEGAVELLDRHDRIDAGFFLRWSELRPARSVRIAELAAMAGATVPEAPADKNQIGPETAGCSTALQKVSPVDLAVCAGGVVYFVFMTYDSRKSPNRALFVSGGFLLGIVLPAALSRGRFTFFVTLVFGVGVIVYARFLEAQRPTPAT